jgi:hypothetical protein
MRRALHNDALYALADRATRIVLVHFLAPHAGKLGLRGQGGHGGSGAALLGDGGALATLAGDCKPGLSLRADAKASAEKIGALSADKEYSSSDPAIRAAKPTVSEILIGY